MPTSPLMLFFWWFAIIVAPIVWWRDRRLLRNVMKDKSSLFDNALDEKNIKAAIATKSEDYYMDKFRKIEAGKAICLNWASFFGGFAWFFYRKMYLYGSLILIAYFIIGTIEGLCDVNNLVTRAIDMICGLLIASRANHLYYRHLTKNKV